ncbi:acetamidase/formamidase family protein [Terracidiphilus sp.]|jgi:acetamidase/formamidase|uniref:acetamidase/formamidase family protein n=1 Tax=Terracidiphilus sp. TaxID=1964191 RepID=UPI003C2169FB
MPRHTLAAQPTHSVWDNSLSPRLRIASGDEVSIQCADASGSQVHPGMTVEQYLAIDRTRIHALTGPIWIENSAPGDVLQIDILSTQHHGWGWSSIVEGLGFLKDRFRTPYLFHWQLDAGQTTSLFPATIPLRPFLGVMGVARADTGSFRTRPPGPFGGNLDVRELSAGATLYLPVFVPGALFSCGDGHAAQGDGEVCINGIECPLDVTLRFSLHKNQPLTSPIVEAPAHIMNETTGKWLIVETGPSLEEAARAATSRMIDLLISRWNLSPHHAYILCSVAMKLRLSQVVNEPIHTITAAISKHILPARQLFPTT